MYFNFNQILTFLILFVLTMLTIAMLQNAGKRISNRFFTLFFFAQIVTFGGYLLQHNPDSIAKLSYLFNLNKPFWFVWAPTLYFAIKFESYFISKFTWKQVFHYLPAIVMAIYLLLSFHFKSIETKQALLKNHDLLTDKYAWLIEYSMKIQVFIYNTLAVILLEKHAQRTSFTTKHQKDRLNWNRFILYTYFATCLIYDFYEFLVPNIISYNTSIILDLIIFSSYFIAILYRAITSPHFTTPIEKERILKVKKSHAKKIKTLLEELVIDQKIFLELDITIGVVAEKLTVKENQLSEVINLYYKQNFNEFINQFRIKEAKKLLVESKTNGQTILEIVYASGFNSKSSFNQVFKNNTGLTPSQFKKEN